MGVDGGRMARWVWAGPSIDPNNGTGRAQSTKGGNGKEKEIWRPSMLPYASDTGKDNQEAQSFPFFSRKTNKNGLQSTWKALQRETLSSPAPVLRTPTILCTSGLTVSHLLCDIRRLILKQITKHGRVTFHCCLIYILIGWQEKNGLWLWVLWGGYDLISHYNLMRSNSCCSTLPYLWTDFAYWYFRKVTINRFLT